jgi:hypothetical protein
MKPVQHRYRFALAAAATLGLFASGAVLARGQPSPEMKAQARALAQACRADFSRLCPDVQRGGGRILACLRGHSDELTPPCHDAIVKVQTLR